MDFLTLAGGFLAFGLLWLVFPRAAFVWVLALYLQYQHNVELFPKDPFTWGVLAGILLVFAIIIGIVLDIIEHQNTYEWHHE